MDTQPLHSRQVGHNGVEDWNLSEYNGMKG